eukprot:gene1085-1022_t
MIDGWPTWCALLAWWFLGFWFAVALLIARVCYWLQWRFRPEYRATLYSMIANNSSRIARQSWMPIRCLTVLGSGGHTMELLQLVKDFDPHRYFLYFTIADTDKTSEPKLRKVLAQNPRFADSSEDLFAIKYIPRAREVGQSFLTSIFTTLYSIAASFWWVFSVQPHLIIVNGPGTCVPIVIVAMFYECFLGRRVCLIFVESFCRTRNLSLTGKILYNFMDRVVVHHQALVDKFPKAEYLGCIY